MKSIPKQIDFQIYPRLCLMDGDSRHRAPSSEEHSDIPTFQQLPSKLSDSGPA